jgi:hypothetical protein
VHCQRTHPKEVFGFHLKNGELFQRIHSRVHRAKKNCEDDELAKAAAHNTVMPADVFFHVLEDASVKTIPPEPRVINIIEGEDWRAPIMAYLHHYY